MFETCLYRIRGQDTTGTGPSIVASPLSAFVVIINGAFPEIAPGKDGDTTDCQETAHLDEFEHGETPEKKVKANIGKSAIREKSFFDPRLHSRQTLLIPPYLRRRSSLQELTANASEFCLINLTMYFCHLRRE